MALGRSLLRTMAITTLTGSRAFPGSTRLNLSQPDWNDMDRIFDATVERDVLVVGLARSAADAALQGGRDLRGLVHCR